MADSPMTKFEKLEKKVLRMVAAQAQLSGHLLQLACVACAAMAHTLGDENTARNFAIKAVRAGVALNVLEKLGPEAAKVFMDKVFGGPQNLGNILDSLALDRLDLDVDEIKQELLALFSGEDDVEDEIAEVDKILEEMDAAATAEVE